MTSAGKPAQASSTAQAEIPARNSPDTAADPFGLWRIAVPGRPAADGGAVSFSFSERAGAQPSAPDGEVFIWTLPLTSKPGGSLAGEKELGRRAAQVQAVTSGLDLAAARAETLVSGHLQKSGVPAASAAAAASATAAAEAAPEVHLAFALNALAQTRTGEEVNFGLGEDLSRLAGQAQERLPGGEWNGVDWEALYQRLNGLMDSVNRQMLHFAWVDTTLDGHLAARTTVGWTGDTITLWQPGLSAEQCAAHCRSLELAMASRSASLRTIFTVLQIAGKIALAAGSPLLAMSLAWQFVQEVVMPKLEIQ